MEYYNNNGIVIVIINKDEFLNEFAIEEINIIFAKLGANRSYDIVNGRSVFTFIVNISESTVRELFKILNI